ncbi:hypothetical protein IWZ00DRAFT_165723 [Phyllosticta capitalensis]
MRRSCQIWSLLAFTPAERARFSAIERPSWPISPAFVTSHSRPLPPPTAIQQTQVRVRPAKGGEWIVPCSVLERCCRIQVHWKRSFHPLCWKCCVSHLPPTKPLYFFLRTWKPQRHNALLSQGLRASKGRTAVWVAIPLHSTSSSALRERNEYRSPRSPQTFEKKYILNDITTSAMLRFYP